MIDKYYYTIIIFLSKHKFDLYYYIMDEINIIKLIYSKIWIKIVQS